jgi:cystathionine gamma-synthase
MSNKLSLDTTLARAGHFVDAVTGAIVPPVQPSTTFARHDDYGLIGKHAYARNSNPGLDTAESLLAELDGGADAMLFGSGMAAITTAMEVLRSGDRVVAPSVMYHGTRDWLLHLKATRGVDVVLFDAAEDGALEKAVAAAPTTFVWIESAVNPTWDVIDIAAAAKAAHAAGAWLGVDATVSPPVTTRALALGADLVFHSATKYMNGHSDVTAGVLVTARDDDRWAEMKKMRTSLGGILGAFEVWLLIRGLRTLALRYERASFNAQAIADHFEQHPGLKAVLYPGLRSHPRHTVAREQMTGGFGGMLSLRVKGGASEAKAIAGRTRMFARATSLGGVESLIEHRATVESAGSLVPEDLLRVSVGIENVADLIADLEQALAG